MFGAVLRCGLVDFVLGCLFLVFPSSFGGVVGDDGVMVSRWHSDEGVGVAFME